MSDIQPGESYVFGEWDAPITDDDTRIPTPVGLVCWSCQEAVKDGDNGRITQQGFVEHRECSLRGVMGGIGHLVDHVRYCGNGDTDAGLTRRRSGLLALEFLQETGFFNGREPTPDQIIAWRERLLQERQEYEEGL